ncbi:BstXI family restriction endonuclease [Neisseria sicca]|uniref:BstXI family restriction endonuclease n=1 Tax=Neisseria sicca TaxID=490 RepID=UPI000D31D4D0|nr:BstXI family restriction endonuclease [Neisseria sicca]
MSLCLQNGCRKLSGHRGLHDPYSPEPWAFMGKKDKEKLSKAGFATPRGGAKGAYQNHVLRSNKVIVPYERRAQAPLASYQDGYVFRLFPDQYFDGPGQVKAEFSQPNAPQVGANAFVLYRTHSQLANFPPLAGWRIRSLLLNGQPVTERVAGAVDVGEYVLRIAAHGNNAARTEGPPQGIFAPEYATKNTNYLAKCMLAWLTAHTVDSPYVAAQAQHLEKILQEAGLFQPREWEAMGLLRSGHTSCPLCMKHIKYSELHDQVSFADEASLLNASEQVENATRSTVVNLFHMVPLTYSDIGHIPQNVAWGHAICNTKLGQRKCYPLSELIAGGSKVGVVDEVGAIATFGWISQSLEMIRSPAGAVWIRIVEDHLSAEDQAALTDFLEEYRGH